MKDDRAGLDRFLLFRTFDELDVGDTQTTMGRTITEADIVSWCALTGGLDAHHPEIVRKVGPSASALVPSSDRMLRFPIAA